MVIEEKNYIDYMSNIGEPYLQERCTVKYLEREEGHKIYCELFESDSEMIKGIVVISHGFTDTATKFHEVVWEFLTNGYNVCLPEHCGHGRSYRLVDGDLSLVHIDKYTRYIDDLEYVAEYASQRWDGMPLYLFAHSMGGGIGADLIGRNSNLFSKAILSSPMIRPLTAGIPWRIAVMVSGAFCALGKSKGYVIGQHPYEDNETLEISASTSCPRFEYYYNIKRTTPLFHTSAASYGWLYEMTKLNSDIMNNAIKNTKCPVILFQSESDAYVSKDEQVKYIDKLKKYHLHPKEVKLVPVENTKHEIHRATSDVLEGYWNEIFEFLR